jgi:Holliday junction resolvasome RuvABC endonuclease subunit
MEKDKETIDKNQVLALDLGARTGYHSVHESGTWNFTESKRRNDNKMHGAFRTMLISFIRHYGIHRIVIEDVVVNQHFFDLRRLAELRGILLEVCDTLDLPEPEAVNPSTLKKWATGNGRADKMMMMQACEEKYHYVPPDDNAADACHLYYYYCRKYRL